MGWGTPSEPPNQDAETLGALLCRAAQEIRLEIFDDGTRDLILRFDGFDHRLRVSDREFDVVTRVCHSYTTVQVDAVRRFLDQE